MQVREPTNGLQPRKCGKITLEKFSLLRGQWEIFLHRFLVEKHNVHLFHCVQPTKTITSCKGDIQMFNFSSTL